MFQRQVSVSFGDRTRRAPNTGPSSALKVKLRKLITPVAEPAQFRRIGFLDDGVRQHRGAGSDAHENSHRVAAKNVGLPNSTQVSTASSTIVPPKMTGLRRPSRSEMKPSSGQPIIQPSGTVAASITAASYSRPRASCRKRTPHVMPKMVVGMNNSPEIKPHRMDCGFAKTVFSETSSCRHPPDAGGCDCGSLGRNSKQADADRQSDDAGVDPELAPGKSVLDERPDEKLPGRPARHAEHLRGADERRGHRGREIFGDEIHGADEREHAAGTLQEAADVRGGHVAGAEQQCARRRPAPRRSG